MRTRLVQLVACACLTLAAFAGLVHAQGDRQVMIQALELDNADIRVVLKAIFQKANSSFTVDPDLQGKVTMRVANLPLHTVLDHVVRQVGASYAIDQSGVYHFMPKAPSSRPLAEGAGSIAVDESWAYVLRGNQVYRLTKDDLRVVARGTLEPR